MKCYFIFISFASFIAYSNGANILGILPTSSKSHNILGHAILKSLADAGHDITVVTPMPLKNPPSNYQHVEVTGMDKAFIELLGPTPNFFEFRDASSFMMLWFMYQTVAPAQSSYLLNHPNVQEFLKTEKKFDLVIAEVFMTESLYGFAQHFDAPIIGFSTFGSSKWTNDVVGTPSPLSVIPHTFLSYTDRMSFWQRFANAALTLAENIVFNLFYFPKQKQIYNEAFPNANKTLEEVMSNFSLVFLNYHYSLGFPKPYQPNMIEIGGVHVVEPKPLPDNLQKFLDASTNGVIYFSMGSALLGINFPDEKRDAFVKAFSQLKENVLWKYENETVPNQPKNVMVQSWMPQSDILAHPNVKLFITHGGLLGSTESLYHGKPVVGIPIFGDQYLNIARAELNGFGVKLDYNNITESSILVAVNKVLSDPKYSENAKLISERLRDNPMTPAERTVYWAEYVMRHKGAPHFKSVSTELPFWEYHMLDVFLVMGLLFVTILTVQIYILRILCRKISAKLFNRRKVEATKKKKKKN